MKAEEKLELMPIVLLDKPPKRLDDSAANKELHIFKTMKEAYQWAKENDCPHDYHLCWVVRH